MTNPAQPSDTNLQKDRLRLKLLINNLPIDTETELRLNQKIDQLIADTVSQVRVDEVKRLPPFKNAKEFHRYTSMRVSALKRRHLMGEQLKEDI